MSLTREAGCRYQSESVEDTERFGELVAAFLNEGDVLILTGGLGVGKTHFTKGVSRGLGDAHPVTSPTFALMAVHDGGRIPLFTLTCIVWSMPTNSKTRASLTCLATKARVCSSGANSSKMSCVMNTCPW